MIIKKIILYRVPPRSSERLLTLLALEATAVELALKQH
jgi:hypothetical protein